MKKNQIFYIYILILILFSIYFFMVWIPILNLAKHFFHGLVLVLIPTSWCQLGLQKPNLESTIFTFQLDTLTTLVENSIYFLLFFSTPKFSPLLPTTYLSPPTYHLPPPSYIPPTSPLLPTTYQPFPPFTPSPELQRRRAGASLEQGSLE